MYEFTILIILTMYLALLTNALRWLQKIWSEPRVDKLLYLLITLINLDLEKGNYSIC